MNTIETELRAFANQHLRRDIPSRVRKLGEELGEFHEALAAGNTDGAVKEAADVALVLTDLVDLLSGGSACLSQEMHAKLEIVKQRKYANGSRVRT
jgi:NTP pyrophosphatase (non-canonical NTP hydrolase)